jgi:S1-C subfamily serine protease
VQWTDVGSLAKIQLQRAKEIMELSVPVAVRGDMPEVTLPTFYLQLSQDPEGLNAPQIELRQVQPQGKSDTVNVVASSNPPRLGIVGDDLTLQLGKYFGVDGGRGVLVITVTEGSLAERYGMKAGDVIVAMNGEAVSNQLEFFRILTRHGSNPIWDFRLVRERKLIDLRVFPQRPKE